MPRPPNERVLLIGDTDRQVQGALAQALPTTAEVVAVPSVFDGIAELAGGGYTSVLAAAEPIERRPESAVRTLRMLIPNGRVLLFGHPTLEPLSRKMLDFGVDDYVITPTTPGELQQVFGAPVMRVGGPTPADALPDEPTVAPPIVDPPQIRPSLPLSGIPLAEIVLDAMLGHPHDAAGAAVRRGNAALGSAATLRYAKPDAPVPDPDDATRVLSHSVRAADNAIADVHLVMSADVDDAPARHFLAQLAHLLGKLSSLQERHNQLQRLAITDELTGVHNARYFRHFLAKIIERAREMRFPVTLLLFDIDDFKKYNDEHGHGVGDEILRQTASLMKRCVREHDCVARLGGDEFGVIFWEKEGPRKPLKDGAGTPGRPPTDPLQVFERFRGLMDQADFPGLGASGRGVLTISAGLAVYPYDANGPDALYGAADKALMFKSKKAGKNTIFLVGSDDPTRSSGE